MKQRPLRKSEWTLSWDDCKKILAAQTDGVLGLVGADGYPYPVPMNYLFAEDKIITHSAVEGYKLECIGKNPRAGFTVYNVFEVKETTSTWESVMVFGSAEIVQNADDKQKYMRMLAGKFGNAPEGFPPQLLKRFAVIIVNIEEYSGKIKQ